MEEDILKEFKQKFEELKEELGFKSTLEEIDSIFFVKDFIQQTGFVSTELGRQLCHRILDTYSSWNSYLHGIIIPNPQNILSITESKMFSNEEKENMLKLIKKSTALISENQVIGLTKDKKAESKFIDSSVKFWESEFEPGIKKITEKIKTDWSNSIKN